jgi:hypothetical protein
MASERDDPIWNRDTYAASITSTCFSSTPYDTGWDGAPQWDIDGAILQADLQMRRLLELEVAIQPVRVRATQIARQIEALPPCGWAFPQFIEAVCRNIGTGDPKAANPSGCYEVGGARLGLMAAYSVCLDGWLKGVAADEVGAALQERSTDGRDWHAISSGILETLGERTKERALLVRRLLARLRFWLRAPYGSLKADDNPRLGYLYTHAMGRYGGWDYFSFENHDPEIADLEQRIRGLMPAADRWLELINCTWPCAPKVFRYIERLIGAIGNAAGPDAAPPEPGETPVRTPSFRAESTYLSSDASRRLYRAALHALAAFVSDAFPTDVMPQSLPRDARFAEWLRSLLGETSPQKVWLAALLWKRIRMFEESYKSFHFTMNAHQTTS